MATLTRRPFTDADLASLQSAVAGWIAEVGRCGYDHIGELPHRIYENLRGRRLDELVHVWVDEHSIVGLTICLRFGCAFDVFVAPWLRGTPVERQLIDDAYTATARYLEPGEEYVSTDAFSCDQSRIDALQRRPGSSGTGSGTRYASATSTGLARPRFPRAPWTGPPRFPRASWSGPPG